MVCPEGKEKLHSPHVIASCLQLNEALEMDIPFSRFHVDIGRRYVLIRWSIKSQGSPAFHPQGDAWEWAALPVA
jgi:hypothetical protein